VLLHPKFHEVFVKIVLSYWVYVYSISEEAWLNDFLVDLYKVVSIFPIFRFLFLLENKRREFWDLLANFKNRCADLQPHCRAKLKLKAIILLWKLKELSHVLSQAIQKTKVLVLTDLQSHDPLDEPYLSTDQLIILFGLSSGKVFNEYDRVSINDYLKEVLLLNANVGYS
jgi:hypothetical protein